MGSHHVTGQIKRFFTMKASFICLSRAKHAAAPRPHLILSLRLADIIAPSRLAMEMIFHGWSVKVFDA